jgi:hypothetical protein
MDRWRRWWGRPRVGAAAEPAAPPEHAGSGAFLGGILGGILGWLIGAGALPHPAFLPLKEAEPLLLAVALAAFGAVVGGVSGAIADAGAPPENAAPPSTTSGEHEAHEGAGRTDRRE